MDKKIELGITTGATQAVAGIETADKAQQGFIGAIKKAQKELKSAQDIAGDVRQFESLESALRMTQKQASHNSAVLTALSAKQTLHLKLTDAETVSLKNNQKALEVLNRKKAQGINLTDKEQQKLVRSESVVYKLTKKKNAQYKHTKKEQAELERLRQKASSLKAQEKNQSRQISKLESKLEAVGINPTDLPKAKDIADRRVEKSAQLLDRENRLLSRSNELQQRKKDVLQSMPSSNATAGAILSTGAVMMKKSAVNDASFLTIARNFDFGNQGAQGQEAQALRRELNSLAVELAGVDSSQIMAIAGTGANSGIGKEDLVAYTRETVMASSAWGIKDKVQAAQQGMKLRNALGYRHDESGQKKFMHMANMINEVDSKNSGVNASDLVHVMASQGEFMMNAGFSESQALGLSGALLANGASKKEATIAVKDITAALSAGLLATDGQKNTFKKLGTDAESVSLGMTKDATATLLGVLDGIKGLDTQEQAAAIKSIFGDKASPLITKMLKDTEQLTQIQENAASASSNSVNKEYQENASTRLADIERSNDAFSQLAIVLGDKAWPALRGFYNGVTDLTIATTDWIAESGMASSAVLGLGASVVAGIAAYKVYQGIKFATNITSIAKEALALKSQQSATDKATAAANRHTAAMERQARATGGARVSESGRAREKARPSSRRRRAGKRSLGMRLFSGVIQDSPSSVPGGHAPDSRSAKAKGWGMPIHKLAKVTSFVRPLSMAFDAVSFTNHLMSGDKAAAAKRGGGLLGGLGGAAAGAALGSMVLPGIGTVIGAGIGGMLGDVTGEDIGSTIFSWFKGDGSTPSEKPASEGAKAVASPEFAQAKSPELATEHWINQSPLPNKMEEIRSNQIHKAEQTQRPSVTFSPVVQISGAQAPEQTAMLTMEAIQQALTQFAQEHGLDSENLTQDFEHSLVN
ncbi:hypothetical protein A3712_20625 [Vibrio sp. HI00D65]|uniref:phage tail tape measure protein n=1 Tax=Vibrio sp. HI00D65 TaxID=1822216 RepID=UPI0007BABEC1|nr:phage tail tape measure protein [Vibrio sp. HI00D65]KZX63832.1 hypothetical protein A3712_20625 [Vibrio sp. HI00D65]